MVMEWTNAACGSFAAGWKDASWLLAMVLAKPGRTPEEMVVALDASRRRVQEFE